MLRNLLTRYSFEQAVSDFLKAKEIKAQNTRESYERSLCYYRQYVGTRWPPTADDIDTFLAASKARGLGKASLHNQYRNIRCWLNWLERRGKLSHNPIKQVDAPAKYEPLPQAIAVDRLQKFFNAIAAYHYPAWFEWLRVRDIALFLLLLETGMRISEVCALRLNDLDFPRRTAIIRQAKGDKDRLAVFNNPRVAKALSNWLDIRASLPIPLECHNVFVTHWRQQIWRPIKAEGVQHARLRYCKLADIPRFRVHDLRHSFAVYALRGLADLLDIQKQMGHSSLEVTLRYTLAEDVGRIERHARYSPARYVFA